MAIADRCESGKVIKSVEKKIVPSEMRISHVECEGARGTSAKSASFSGFFVCHVEVSLQIDEVGTCASKSQEDNCGATYALCVLSGFERPAACDLPLFVEASARPKGEGLSGKFKRLMIDGVRKILKSRMGVVAPRCR